MFDIFKLFKNDRFVLQKLCHLNIRQIDTIKYKMFNN